MSRWFVRLLAMAVIAGVVGMHSLVGVHVVPAPDHGVHHATSSGEPAVAAGGATSHEESCRDHGCGTVCVALLLSLLLAAVARRRTVWAAPLSDLHRVLANRDLRRGEWLLPPAPMLLGISRT